MQRRNSQRDRDPLVALDIFAGAGGLSLGLRNAGFRVAGAVEIDAEAFSTYKANHPETIGLNQDVRTVKGRSLLRKCGVEQVDLLAGCPPCQGFSSLTAQWHRWDDRFFTARFAALIAARGGRPGY